MRSLFCAAVLALSVSAASATAAAEWQQLRERDRAYRSDLTLVTARGNVDAAEHRALALTLELRRILGLAAQNAVERARVNQSNRARKLADIELEEARVIFHTAQSQKEMDDLLPSCQAGSAVDCDQVAALYQAIFASRKKAAALDVRRADAELEHETLHVDSMTRLLANNAISNSVLAEARIKLEARKVDVRTAKAKLALAMLQ